MKIDSVIDNNITVMSKAVQENDHRQQISDRKSGQTVFAGDMQGDFALQDRMQQRKELAQKRAMMLCRVQACLCFAGRAAVPGGFYLQVKSSRCLSGLRRQACIVISTGAAPVSC